MIFTIAYADPPYYGLASFYEGQHPDWQKWDTLEAHADLIDGMSRDYPDGWALSLHTPSLKHILPLCPDDVRVGAWVKPFASFKPGVNPAYAWEPVIFRGGRRRTDKAEPTVRDWCAVNITLRRGFTGAKPEAFCWWLFELMGLQPLDTFVDLFPGSGAVTRAWRTYATERLFGVDGRCRPTQNAAPPAETPEETAQNGYFQVLHGAYPALTTETTSGGTESGNHPAPTVLRSFSADTDGGAWRRMEAHGNGVESHPNPRASAPPPAPAPAPADTGRGK